MKRFSIGTKYKYCPNGNYWQDVSGLFDTQLFLFCDCNKCQGQVYVLKAFNVTKKIDKKQIEKFRKWNKLEKVRSEITVENMLEVEKITNQRASLSQ